MDTDSHGLWTHRTNTHEHPQNQTQHISSKEKRGVERQGDASSDGRYFFFAALAAALAVFAAAFAALASVLDCASASFWRNDSARLTLSAGALVSTSKQLANSPSSRFCVSSSKPP